MNFYDFHIGDYTSRTAHLDPLEDLAYRRMLDLYYTREAALPADVEKIARLIRMRANVQEIQVVLAEFFVSNGAAGWSHEKCEEVIAAANAKKASAKKSAEARWSKTVPHAGAMQSQCERMQNASETECDGNAPSPSPSPITTTDVVVAPQSAAAKPKRGSRLPDDWFLPQHWGQWALEKFPHFTPDIVRDEALKFANHWRSATGKTASKLDWYATWQNWCMSDICQRSHPPPGQTSETPYARQMRERVAEAAGSFAHIVAAKAPGQQSKPSPTPWDIAIENNRRTAATGLGGCDLLETVVDVRS